MGLEWKESLAVGVDEIDNQHKELFKAVNNLLDACSRGDGKEETEKMMKFLGEYVIRHFSAEERYQQRSGYPDYANHKKLHDEFIIEFKNMQEQYHKSGANGVLIIQMNKKVSDWLLRHIGRVDKALGEYLKSKV